MKSTLQIYLLLAAMVSTITIPSLQAQEGEKLDRWDNNLWFGTKVGHGKNKYRYSGEFQVRLKDNFQSLDTWFMEGVYTYTPSKAWELVPDIRFSIKSNSIELRPGFGIVNKQFFRKKIQLVNQIKYQLDISNTGIPAMHGLRYAVFFNYVINKKLIPNAVFGVFYRWKEDFIGLEFMRFGGGLAYIIDVKHTMNFTYFIGSSFVTKQVAWINGLLVQFIFNINPEYKYLPAKYYNF